LERTKWTPPIIFIHILKPKPSSALVSAEAETSIRVLALGSNSQRTLEPVKQIPVLFMQDSKPSESGSGQVRSVCSIGSRSMKTSQANVFFIGSESNKDSTGPDI
jgi:hypothetical protein